MVNIYDEVIRRGEKEEKQVKVIMMASSPFFSSTTTTTRSTRSPSRQKAEELEDSLCKRF